MGPDEARLILEKNLSLGKTSGEEPVLVLAIQFPDVPAQLSIAGLDSVMNLDTFDGAVGTGGFRDYFEQVSYGQFVPVSHVFGWYTSKYEMQHYLDLGSAGRDSLFHEALDQAEAEGVDFSEFAFEGRQMGPVILQTSEIIAAQARISQHNRDGVDFLRYTIQGLDNATEFRLGTTVHEYGHVLGLPDLYLTNEPVGLYDVMSHAKGQIPGNFSAWSKKQLGWLEPVVIEGSVAGVEIPASYDSPTAVLVYDEPYQDGTYFLIENRQQIGYDTGNIPSEGLVIYHVDDTAKNEWVRVLQADGLDEMRLWNTTNGETGNVGDAGDFFPGSTNNRAVTAQTNPGTLTFDGTDWGVAITNISDSAPVMTADIRSSTIPGYTLRHDDGIRGYIGSQSYSSIPFDTYSVVDSIWAGAVFEPAIGDTVWAVKTSSIGYYPDGIASVDDRQYHLRIFERLNPDTGSAEGLLYEQDGAIPLPITGAGPYFVVDMARIWLDEPLEVAGPVFVALTVIRDRNEPNLNAGIATDVNGEPSGKSYLAYAADYPVFTAFQDIGRIWHDVTLRVLMRGNSKSFVAVEPSELPDDRPRLASNAPNPFVDRTTVHFQVSEPGHVRVQVFDVRGKRVARLVDGYLTPGRHQAIFEAEGLPAGVYFYRVEARSASLVGSMVLQ